MVPSDKETIPTPDNALNALSELLRDILEGLTVVELFAGSGRVSQRFLQEGAAKAVCVDDEPPEDHVEMDGMVWITMDVMDFLEQDRVQDIGLVYSAPPYGSDYNRKVLERLPSLESLQKNCLVILEEPTWHQTPLKEFPGFEEVETFQFKETKITVTQMVESDSPD